MKLLFDENLISKLVQSLEADYPGSAHVSTLGLRGATDESIWEHARHNAYAIISKDNDFRQLSFFHGAPPKVIWLSVGNAGTEGILRFQRSKRVEIQIFEVDEEASLLVLPLVESTI